MVWGYSDPLFTYRISDFQQISLNFYSTYKHTFLLSDKYLVF